MFVIAQSTNTTTGCVIIRGRDSQSVRSIAQRLAEIAKRDGWVLGIYLKEISATEVVELNDLIDLAKAEKIN